MSEVFAAYLKQLEVLHRDLTQAFEGLSVEALNWSPGPEVNSLAVLAAHTAGSERYWIGDVIARDDSHRDRDSEFRMQAGTGEEALERLEVVLAYSRNVVKSLTHLTQPVESVAVHAMRQRRSATRGHIVWT
jgi:hypothetical protein